MFERITGTEMEYGLHIQSGPSSRSGPSPKYITPGNTIVSTVDGFLPPKLYSIEHFRSNGSRLYTDSGQHPEYATPEDTSIYGTVVNEIAGERILYDALLAAHQAKRLNKFTIHKRLIDDEGETWGHHENYYVKRDKVEIDRESLALIGIHLATVNVFTGAGGLVRPKDQEEWRLVVAQKPYGLAEDFSIQTTGASKPVVNLRDQSHADERSARVHVTSGDANMSPWAMFMKLGTTSLALRLRENGYKTGTRLDVGPLLPLALQVAGDLTLQETVVMSYGRRMRPIDIQEVFINDAIDLSEKVKLPKEELLALEEWKKAHDDARRDPELLADRADWVARKQLLEGYREKSGHRLEHPKMRQLDQLYDNLSPKGIGNKYRKTRWARWMPDDSMITRRQITPPQTTRAKLRGKFISRFANNKRVKSEVDWDSVKHNGRLYSLKNPYMTSHPGLEQLIDSAA